MLLSLFTKVFGERDLKSVLYCHNVIFKKVKEDIMKRYLLALLSGCAFIVSSAFAITLEFSKDTVNAATSANGTGPSAMMKMDDGNKHTVQLPNTVSVKDIHEGQKIFIPAHNASFKVTKVATKDDGSKVVDIEPANGKSTEPASKSQY
jgi:hypothetical protein